MSGKIILIIIATLNPNEKESLNHYLQQMSLLYKEVGATPVNKYKISESLIGEEKPHMVSIMAFPNRESIDKVFKSEAYQALLPYREKAFVKVEAIIGE